MPHNCEKKKIMKIVCNALTSFFDFSIMYLWSRIKITFIKIKTVIICNKKNITKIFNRHIDLTLPRNKVNIWNFRPNSEIK